jgi:hypothetical protein
MSDEKLRSQIVDQTEHAKSCLETVLVALDGLIESAKEMAATGPRSAYECGFMSLAYDLADTTERAFDQINDFLKYAQATPPATTLAAEAKM